MNIIQSYIPYKNPYKIDLDKDYLYSMMLSSILLKKHYGKVTLYTNEKQKSFLERFNFPYEYDTTILSKEKGDVFAFTKLNSILSQTTDFIHFDLDTFVFKPFNLDKYKSNFIFSHNDIGTLAKDLEKFETIEEQLGSQSYKDIYDTYLKFYFINKNKLENNKEFESQNLKLSQIPNMNVICVRNKGVDIFKQAIQSGYSVYNDIKKDIDREWIGSAFIEQLTIPLKIKELCKDYKDEKYNSVLFGDSPMYPKYKSGKVIFKGNEYCSECGLTHESKIKIDLLNENLSKLRYFHSGGNKHDKFIKYLVLKTLIDLIGIDGVIEINNTFNFIHSENNRASYLSDSEKMYNEYMNTDIFTLNKNKSLF